MKYIPCPKCRARGKDSRGDNLVVWPDDSKHCFSCGYHENAPHQSHWKPKETINVIKEALPRDFTRDIPTAAWKWLLQYELPYSFWKESCGYSPSTGRLVFLVGSPMVFSIGRLIETEKPGRKWYVWGDCHKSACFGRGGSEVPKLRTVLVEDWISANKVAQVEECLPLFGVEPRPAHIYALSDGSERPITLWLDKDQEGSSQKKAARLQMLTGRPVSVLHTDNDPKKLSINQIKELL